MITPPSSTPLRSPRAARWLAPAALLASLAWPSAAHADELTVDLYTVGAGNYVYAAHGHSALCVTGGAHPEGRCYD